MFDHLTQEHIERAAAVWGIDPEPDTDLEPVLWLFLPLERQVDQSLHAAFIAACEKGQGLLGGDGEIRNLYHIPHTMTVNDFLDWLGNLPIEVRDFYKLLHSIAHTTTPHPRHHPPHPNTEPTHNLDGIVFALCSNTVRTLTITGIGRMAYSYSIISVFLV